MHGHRGHPPPGPNLVGGPHLSFSAFACRSGGHVFFLRAPSWLFVHRWPGTSLLGLCGPLRLLWSDLCDLRTRPRHRRAQGRGSRPCHARVGVPLDRSRLCGPLPRLRRAPGPLGRLRGNCIAFLRALACCAARFRHRERRCLPFTYSAMPAPSPTWTDPPTQGFQWRALPVSHGTTNRCKLTATGARRTTVHEVLCESPSAEFRHGSRAHTVRGLCFTWHDMREVSTQKTHSDSSHQMRVDHC